MLIQRVELQDIKSHANSVYEFHPGTTAITGANGAGKTTIIEGIAWAIFDFLEYNRDDFARRGTKKGIVRVNFQSGLDEKNYVVYRDTAGKHRVYDEQNTVIHEQSANVINFLRQHLQVEPGTNLRELYRAAIGVPQGTFTAVFLDNATTRKAVFDRLLKVEEYRESAKKLGDTTNLIKEKQSEVKLRLAVAENELEKYEETNTAHAAVVTEIEEHELILGELKTEIEINSRKIADFETAKTNLDNAANVLRELQTRQSNALRDFANIETQRDAAKAAAEKLVQVEPDYNRFLTAENELKTLEIERAERDKIKAEIGAVDKNLINAKAENQSLNRDLTRAVEAGQEIETLKPQIVEQERLEAEYKILLTNQAEANAANQSAANLQPEIDAKRSEFIELRDKIKDSEKGADAENQIQSLEAQRREIEADLTQTGNAVSSLKVLQPQFAQNETDLKNARENLNKTERELADLEKFAPHAARVGELSAIEISLNQKIADLRAAMTVDAKFVSEVKNGLCPILSQKCLNLREGESLETYFSGKGVSDGDALRKFETERAAAAIELQNAREAEKQTAKLTTLQTQKNNLTGQIAERENLLVKLRGEIDNLSAFTPEKQNNLAIEKRRLESEIGVWQKAAQNYAALEGLRRRIENLEKEGRKLSDEQKNWREKAAKLNDIENQIAVNQTTLRDLKNPKGRAENCQREAARKGEIEIQIGKIAAEIGQFETQKTALETDLAKFAALDEKLGTTRAVIEQTRAAHGDFIRHQAVAEKLPNLEIELEKLKTEVEKLKIEVETAQINFDEFARNYNAEQHLTIKTALEKARTRETAENATLVQKRSRAAQLEADLARLTEVRLKLNDDLQASEKLRKIFETTDYIRETLKKAAPHVGEILRYEIAKAATNLFREVTGEVGRSLKWSEDYEIILDENGYQRPFANLSGGEQMAAALSIRLSLLTQLSDVRIAFFDEPTTNLDTERRENLAKQIGQITNFNQLFVISHDDTFESEVDFQINIGGES